MKTWSIQRHGGNSNHVWRTIFTGDEMQCRAQFDREVAKMRQGGLSLRDKDGRAVDSKWAPRLRTRW